MRSIRLFLLAAVVAIAVSGTTAFVSAKRLKKAKTENKGFAVVELFTSEGCSSCPPADELVAKIEKESKDQPVYILAYHVDYWDRLGWKDVFSAAEFTRRQYLYASFLHLQQVYTPQVIVNGKTEFVGSEEASLRNAIKTNLLKTPAMQLTFSVTNADHNKASLKYAVDGADKNTALLVAVLQKNAQSKVENGENSGRTLSHVQIVRKLQQVALSGNDGTVNVSLPKGFDSNSWEIVGFLQNTSNGAIGAASRAAFPAALSVAGAKSSK